MNADKDRETSPWLFLSVFICVHLWFIPSSVFADFRFIHCSDSHAGTPENTRVDAAMFKEMSQLQPLPKFVILTGDVVNYGTDEEYAQFAGAAKNLGDLPLYLAPGNHDVRWNPRGKEGYTLGSHGKLFQSWDYENIHFVTLDSTVLLEHWGHISQEQLDWLKNDLAKVGTEKPVIIGFHHWIGRDPVMVDNEQELMNLVAPYNIVLWLQGHGHADIEWNIDGVPATMVKGLYQASYDIIDVTPSELRITKRFLPQNKTDELLKSATQPSSDLPDGKTRLLMTIPLAKRARPNWSASVDLRGQNLAVHVDRGELPADAKVDVQIDTNPATSIDGDVKNIAKDAYAPGVHVATVIVTCADGRVYRKPFTMTLPGTVSPAWITNIGGAVQSRLALSGDRLYVTSMGNDLVALNAGDGKEIFRAKTGAPIFSSPEVADGVVYFGSADHFVYAVDATSGEIKWKHETGGAVLAGPAVTKGVVCIGSCDKNIYGLSVSDGHEIWHVAGENMFQSKAATDGEHFFVGGWDNHFRCINAAEGKLAWDLTLGKRQPLPGFSAYAPSITNPCVGGGKVFVSTNDGVFHAINIADGREAWRVDRKNMGYSSPCFHDGKVYFALSDKGDTYCADADTGKILWQRNVGSVIYDGGFCYGGNASGGNVFIGCVDGVFNALNANSGEIIWQYSLGPGHLLATAAADDNRVYID